jgi:uncharacterized protein YecT (DUF1311 family)
MAYGLFTDMLLQDKPPGCQGPMNGVTQRRDTGLSMITMKEKNMRRIRFAAAEKITGTAVLLVLGMSLAMPGFALDCAKAKQVVQKRICANASLRAADARMNVAYAAILKAAPDAEIRAALVRSQRHWVKERNESLDTVQVDDDPVPQPMPLSQIRNAINTRTRNLSDRSNNGFIARAQREQQLAKQYPGSFTGINADCEFFPADTSGTSWSYNCTGMVNMQNNHGRICSASLEWATWTEYNSYAVSVVEGGKVKPLAVCGMTESQDECVGDDGLALKDWLRFDAGDINNIPLPSAGLPKLDVDFDDDSAARTPNFFDRCLTDPKYPAQLH